MSNILKKMSIAAMGCKPVVVRDSQYAPDKNIKLATVYGRASGTKSGENRSGNSEIWTALIGSFEGMNVQAGSPGYGKLYSSGMLFLPGGSQEIIEGALANGGLDAAVDFAFEIYARHDEKSPVGYRYQVASLQPPSVTDDLAHLRKIALPAETRAQIEAPAPPEVKEPEPEPASAPTTAEIALQKASRKGK